MTNEERKKKQAEINEIPIVYCSKCLSLRVVRKNGSEHILYCDNCGADAFHLDSCNIFRWQELCEERKRSELIARKSDIYKDIQEVYKQATPECITEAECIENGSAAGVRVTDYLYRNLHNLDKRSNPTEKVLKQITDKTIEQLTDKVMEQLSDCSDNNALISTNNE